MQETQSSKFKIPGLVYKYESGQLTCTVDIEKISEHTQKYLEFYKQNKDMIQIDVSLLFTGLSGLYIFKKVVKLYANESFDNINNLKISEMEKVKYSMYKSNQIAKFAGKKALLVTGGLMIFSKVFGLLSDHKNLIGATVKIDPTPSNSDNATSYLYFFTILKNKFKGPKWLFFLIVLLISIVFILFLITYR